MDRAETVDILNFCAATWDNFKPTNKEETIKSWLVWLTPYRKEDVLQAVQVYGLTSKENAFAPKPNIIASMINQSTKQNAITEGEAWNLVSKAISRGIYHSVEAFDRLPESVQKAVGSPRQIEEWAQTDLDSLTVVESNFKRNYRTIIERESAFDGLSPEIRARIESAQKLAIGETK